ncbi:hypothetical protein SAMN05421541_106217 [Actinoplanes philippinensis]|uniref:Uncharacterized protein n=1 Tax=Actinoplanes philippinensis TaxID=35752 RepID=A0A1I2G469_9ACTN|nr:hypothetical protein SAMN05421541_106217 [Actinoplanes philippinensis]
MGVAGFNSIDRLVVDRARRHVLVGDPTDGRPLPLNFDGATAAQATGLPGIGGPALSAVANTACAAVESRSVVLALRAEPAGSRVPGPLCRHSASRHVAGGAHDRVQLSGRAAGRPVSAASGNGRPAYGKVMIMRVPPPGLSAARMVPSCRSSTRLQIASPSPVPV